LLLLKLTFAGQLESVAPQIAMTAAGASSALVILYDAISDCVLY
jgi:hypothetical protein